MAILESIKSFFRQKKNGSVEKTQELSVNKLEKENESIEERKKDGNKSGRRFWYGGIFVATTLVFLGLIMFTNIGGYVFLIFYFVATYFIYELITKHKKVE